MPSLLIELECAFSKINITDVDSVFNWLKTDRLKYNIFIQTEIIYL